MSYFCLLLYNDDKDRTVVLAARPSFVCNNSTQ
jgi:hypothetical protein